MEKKKILCLFLLVVLLLVFSSCHPRHVSDIKLAMTKEEVISLWGPTNFITYETINGAALEIWEYHFATSGSICWVTFDQDRVASTGCRPSERSYYSQSGIQLYSEPYYYPFPYFYGGYYPYYLPYPPPHHPPPPRPSPPPSPPSPPPPPPSPPPHPHHWR